MVNEILDGIAEIFERMARTVYPRKPKVRSYTTNSSAFSNQTFRTPAKLREMRGSGE